jgi:tRNA (guanine-N7-)-methyltransferase
VVQILADHLVPEGQVFLQSDVAEVLLEMGDRFQEHSAFERQTAAPNQTPNPFPIATERESSTLEKGDPIYRMIFAKNLV